VDNIENKASNEHNLCSSFAYFWEYGILKVASSLTTCVDKRYVLASLRIYMHLMR